LDTRVCAKQTLRPIDSIALQPGPCGAPAICANQLVLEERAGSINRAIITRIQIAVTASLGRVPERSIC